MELKAVKPGIISIRAHKTSRFLCMKPHGHLYGSVSWLALCRCTFGALAVWGERKEESNEKENLPSAQISGLYAAERATLQDNCSLGLFDR